MNKKFQDIFLLIMFFVCLSGNFFMPATHEVCGIIFLVAVVVHNFFNRQFYKNFAKRRLSNKLCIIFFAVSLIVLSISGLMLWQSDSDFNWRSVHLVSAIASLIFLFAHLLTHARRYIHGKIFYAASVFTFLLAVAGIFGLPYADRWYHKVEVNSAKIIHGEKISTNEKFLTVYFSRVGNTDFPPGVDAVSGASVMTDGEKIIGNAEMIASMAQDIVGGDLLEMQTEKNYPADYPETTRIAKAEFDNGELPEIKNLPDLNGYDKIIFVYPLWWGTLPKAAESFLKHYDLSGKVIIPIVTHGGGGVGESLEALKKSTRAKVDEKILDIYSSDIPASREKIFDFLKGDVQ